MQTLNLICYGKSTPDRTMDPGTLFRHDWNHAFHEIQDDGPDDRI